MELEHQNVPFMNAALVPLFQSRTLESIKGKRKQAGFRRIINDLRAHRQQLPEVLRPIVAAPEVELIGNVGPVRRYGLRPRDRRLIDYNERND